MLFPESSAELYYWDSREARKHFVACNWRSRLYPLLVHSGRNDREEEAMKTPWKSQGESTCEALVGAEIEEFSSDLTAVADNRPRSRLSSPEEGSSDLTAVASPMSAVAPVVSSEDEVQRYFYNILLLFIFSYFRDRF